MANKLATLLVTAFFSGEKVVKQSNTSKLGSSQQALVIRFDQQAHEDMPSEGSIPSPRSAKPRKTRKI